MAEGKKKRQANADASTPGPRSRKRSTTPADNIDEDISPPTRSSRRQIGGEAKTTRSVPEATPSPEPARSRPRTTSRSEAVGASRAAPAPDPGGVIAERYIDQEILDARSQFRATIVGGIIILIIVIGALGYSTIGFAHAMEPNEAATITEGMIASHLDDYIPQAKAELKEQVPALIGKVPDYAKEQLPKFREQLESQLDKSVQDFAKQSEPELRDMMGKFLTANKEDVHALIENTRDPVATANLETNLRQMFTDYLDNSKVGGETLKQKLDAALLQIAAIDAGVAKLASNKGLSTNEQRARRAIAILMRSVDADPDLRSVADLVQSEKSTVNGMLQWQSPDEAVFQQPGKPPIVFIRKPGATAPAPPSH